jgi:hypothetical protein
MLAAASEYLPGAQSAQAFEPVDAAYLPATQSVQAIDPVDEAN